MGFSDFRKNHLHIELNVNFNMSEVIGIHTIQVKDAVVTLRRPTEISLSKAILGWNDKGYNNGYTAPTTTNTRINLGC